MGLFSSKPGFSNRTYTNRYRSAVHRALTAHNGHTVASSKLKLIDGGIKTITSGGGGRTKGVATSSELKGLIEGLASTGSFTKRDLDGIQQVFKGELAKRDSSHGSSSLFGRPQGISATTFEKNTFSSQSVRNQVYSALGGHDSAHKKALAKNIEAMVHAGLAGGSGNTYHRLTKNEVDSILSTAQSLGGYTTKDIQNLQGVFYRALHEKTNTTTPSRVTHDARHDEHNPTATPKGDTPTTGEQKKKPIMMHTPRVMLGRHIANAASAAPWKEREIEHDIDDGAQGDDINRQHISEARREQQTYDKQTPYEAGQPRRSVENTVVTGETTPQSTVVKGEQIHEEHRSERATVVSESSGSARQSTGTDSTQSVGVKYNDVPERSTTHHAAAVHRERTPSHRSSHMTLQERIAERREAQQRLNNPSPQGHTEEKKQSQGMHISMDSKPVTMPPKKADTNENQINTDTSSANEHPTNEHVEEKKESNSVYTRRSSRSASPSSSSKNADVQEKNVNTDNTEQNNEKKDKSQSMHIRMGSGAVSSTPQQGKTGTNTEQVERGNGIGESKSTTTGQAVGTQETSRSDAESVPDSTSEEMSQGSMLEKKVSKKASNTVSKEQFTGENAGSGGGQDLSKSTTAQMQTPQAVGSVTPPPASNQSAPQPHEESTETTKDKSIQENPESQKAGEQRTGATTEGQGSIPTYTGWENEKKKTDIKRPIKKFTPLKVPIQHISGSTVTPVASDVPEVEAAPPPVSGTKVVQLTTSLGVISMELFEEEMPHTVTNFLKHVKSGFYTGMRFHRVVQNYVIQAGEDPHVEEEHKEVKPDTPEKPRSNSRGTVSVVSTDKNSSGTMFSINLVNNAVLDGRYPVFGRVVAGMDVVDAISEVETDQDESPKQPVLITSVALASAVQTAHESNP